MRARGYRVVVLLVAAVGAAVGSAVAWVALSSEANPPAPAETHAVAWPAEAAAAASARSILDDILGQPQRLRATEAVAFARAFLDALYRRGDIATAVAHVAWSSPHCRIGVFACSELTTPARRAGALVALVPSERLRPTGMAVAEFERRIGDSIQRLAPAPDRAMPYAPAPDEELIRYADHHGLIQYLVLRRAGRSWRVVALGRAEHVARAGEPVSGVR